MRLAAVAAAVAIVPDAIACGTLISANEAKARIQRVADVMRQFLGGSRFNVAEMITNPGS